MRTELQDVLTAMRGMSPEDLPNLIGELEAVKAAAYARMIAPVPQSQPHQSDELLDIKRAAERLSVSEEYLYRRAKRLPFTRRMGRKLLFSSLGIDQYIRRH